MKQICLIDGRFEAVIDGERLLIFDLSAEYTDGGRSPLHVLSAARMNSELDAGRATLEWLRDNGYITGSEFYHGSDELHLRYRNQQ